MKTPSIDEIRARRGLKIIKRREPILTGENVAGAAVLTGCGGVILFWIVSALLSLGLTVFIIWAIYRFVIAYT